MTQRLGLRFPFGTFVINVSGCFLIGLFMYLLTERAAIDISWLYIGVIGFIGAYTTFSTFEYETLRAVQDGQLAMALLYVASSIVVGLVSVWAGLTLGKVIA